MDWENKFVENLLEVLYRADQPRHPAGTPEGGRFAPEGGSGAGGVSQFTPAKTLEEAKQVAKGFAKEVIGYDNLDLDVANQVNEALHEMIVEEGRSPLDILNTDPDSDSQGESLFNIITIGKSGFTSQKIEMEVANYAERAADFKDLQATRKKSIQDYVTRMKEWDPNYNVKEDDYAMRRIKTIRVAAQSPNTFSVCRNMKEVVLHEFGHVAQSRFIDTDLAFHRIHGRFTKILESPASKPHRLSSYAREDADEFFAEAWTAYHTGRKNLLTKEVASIVEEVSRRIN